MPDPLRIGFLGAGLIATYHSKSLRRSGIPVIRAGVHDPDRDRAAAFAAASGHHVCDTEDEVLDGCDAVYVCTWTSEHRRLVEAAARRGVHVFCEKPLAPTLDEAEALAAAVEAAGVVNQVGLVLRRSPAYRWARHLAHEPAAGRIMAVVFRDDQFIPVQGHYASSWRADVERAGAGTLLEHSIHDVDMLRFLVGDIERVSAHISSWHDLDGIEDVAAVLLRFAGGATGTLTSVWHDNLARPSLRRVEVLCQRRLVVVEGDDWFGPVRFQDTDGREGQLAGEALAEAAAEHLDGHPNPDAAFVLAATAGAAAWPDVHTAVAAHRVVDAAYRSAAAGGVPIAPGEPPPRVVELATEEVLPLRRTVLRAGTPSTDPGYAEDHLAGTVHLGVRAADGAVVATSTWLWRAFPGGDDRPAVQVRGMAVAPGCQRSGLGRAIVDAGVRRAAASGAALVWARARDEALGFYRRAGFRVVGEGFVDAATALGHHLVVLELPRG